jgi:prolyl oligopeptidase
MRPTSIAWLAGVFLAATAGAQTMPSDDPNQWLEDVSGDKALDWVRA